MNFPAIDPAWIALIGTLAGGIGLKVTEHWLNRSKTSTDDAKQIREELRAQVVAQKAEIERLEADVDEWRNKYYDLRDSFMQQHTELMLALEKIRVQGDKNSIDVPPKA